MQLTRHLGTMPDDPPPRALVPPHVTEAAEAYEARSAYGLLWSAALQTRFEQERIWQRIPGFQFASYGALDPDLSVLGVVVHARSDRMQEPFTLSVEGAEFPVLTRANDRFRPHRPPDPANGTSACWATSAKLHPRRTYALTAEHNVRGIDVGDPVPLAGGGQGRLVDVAPPGIDAALYAVPTQTSVTQLSAVNFPAPWTTVMLDGHTRATQTTFTRSSDLTGSLDAMLPIRLFLAQPGTPGDSGGLVSDAGGGDGLGIYMGEVANRGGVIEGVCQHLGQVAHVMSLTLYT
jgi:hypothetical protein